jgi:hypothetical protein
MAACCARGNGSSGEPLDSLSLVTQSILLEELEAYEVSTLVNSPENDSPECVRRISKTDKKIPQLLLV